MVPLTARPGVLVPVSGVSVVRGAALVGGFDGGWRDWWVAAVGGCQLLVRLSLSVFRLVPVMVSLAVQMGDSYPGVAVAFGRRWCFRWCSCALAGSGVGVALAGALCAGCVIFASGFGGVGDGGVLGVGAGGGGPMVRVPGTLGGSALLGLLLAIPGGGCWRWCRWWRGCGGVAVVFCAAWVGGGDPWLMLTILRLISMWWVRWCVALLFLPLVRGLVGGAGGVCSPAVVASLVLSSMGAP